ncbi:diguanylate cyclase [Novosphingobium sp.]|uniref:GGDEF domain-containing protein n=1 Tax=Novosphingobium sp. TaxID=1874826 RepID=UPI0033412756
MTASPHRFFRFFSTATDDDSVQPDTSLAPAPAALPALTAQDRANEQLMGDIASFLVGCRLGVTLRNLTIAHAAYSGEDPQLAREIERRRLSGETITQEWLDSHLTNESQESAIRTLIGQLEDSLDRFAHTTHKARTSTADCNAALKHHVDRATHTPESFSVADVLGMAQVILDHSHKLEQDIRTSEHEAKALRERLARAQHDADVDHLTGLPNRRAFEALFDRHYREAQTEIDHLCVAFCDIDNFKLVNDNHGHETGDRVIQAVAETLDRLSSQKCHVARHGGEEFVLLFRSLTKAEARERLDQVRETFSQRRFVNRKTDDPIGRVTFSGGVADVFAYAHPRDALRAADEALYLAKEQGRNAVMAAP